jgi:cytochrome c-type biogenesis protein CcmH/NrfG
MAATVCLGQAVQSVESQRQTALTFEQQGKNAEAEMAWRALLKQYPANPEPHAHLGFLEARQEHYKALALSPSTPGLQPNLGLALFKAGEMKEAVQIFEQLLKSQTLSSLEVPRLATLPTTEVN